jgi:hypothetical protein
MTLAARHRQVVAAGIGVVLGAAPLWLNDASFLWPSSHSDEAQWVLEQLMLPGFAFSALVGLRSHAFMITVVFNVLFFGLMAYSFLVKSSTK